MQQQRTGRSNFDVEAEAVIKKVTEDILSVVPDLVSRAARSWASGAEQKCTTRGHWPA